MKTIDLINKSTSIENINAIVTVAGTTFKMSPKSLRRIAEAAQNRIEELTPKVSIAPVKKAAKKKTAAKTKTAKKTVAKKAVKV
jgi:hypothetical protein